MPVKILVVDDHEIVRQGIRSIISQTRPLWEICGEADDGAQAIEMASKLKPDAIILDVTMPVMGGLNAAQAILQKNRDAKIVIFTMHESKTLAKLVQRSGALGFVVKSEATRDLIDALEAVIGGGTFFQFDDEVVRPNS